jgi:hypothetical protein
MALFLTQVCYVRCVTKMVLELGMDGKLETIKVSGKMFDIFVPRAPPPPSQLASSPKKTAAKKSTVLSARKKAARRARTAAA